MSTRKDIRELHVRFDKSTVVSTTNFRERGIMDSFRFSKTKSTVTGLPVTHMHDDIALLLSFEKKKQLSPEAMSSIVDAMNATGNSDRLDKLKTKLSDDQIISLVKSRHVQSPSELVMWSRYLDGLADQELRGFCDYLDSKRPKAPEPEKIQKVEVVNTPKSE